MSLFTARREQTLSAREATPDQAGGKRRRRTIEDFYRLIDENLAILD